jgi:hypothetical protein
MVIDLFGLKADDVRRRYPEVYQHVIQEVKEKKDQDGNLIGRDVNRRDYRRENWWLFGENNPDLRRALSGLPRYIATVETMRHRVFMFLDAAILPDNKLVAVASGDGFHLGVLSSALHLMWSVRAGGWLGVGNDSVYVKSRCFDPFPFPDAPQGRQEAIRATAEELDAFRKARQREHPRLTLTQMYNVLEKLKANEPLTDADERIKQEGIVLVLLELHQRLDRQVLEAYGWPADLTDDEILARLVDLNRARAREEAQGLVRWLRPDYQAPRFGTPAETADLALTCAAPENLRQTRAAKAPFPTDDVAQTAAVMAVLASAPGPLDAATVSAGFSGGKRNVAKAQAVLASLARMGFVSALGNAFVLRRAA